MDATLARIAEMLSAGHDPAAVSTILGCRFADVVAVRAKLSAKSPVRKPRPSDPPPDEIERLCNEIRADYLGSASKNAGVRQPRRDWSVCKRPKKYLR